MENDIQLSPDYVHTLEIHNKKIFRNICESLSGKAEFFDKEPFYIKNNLRTKDIKPDQLVCITDVCSFETDSKQIIAAVVNRIKLCIKADEAVSTRYHALLNDILEFLFSFNNEFECDFSLDEDSADITKLLKICGLSATNDCASWFDKLLNIITIYADLFPDKALCFFNLKNWLNSEEIDALIAHITNQKISVLLVEATEYKFLFHKEMKIIVDEDFDEQIQQML